MATLTRKRGEQRPGQRRRRRVRAAAALAAVSLLAAACGGGQAGGGGGTETVEMQMASFLSESTAQGQAITRWIDEVEKRTNGAVSVETYWDASLLGAEEIRDGLRDGRVELGNVSYAYTPSEFPLTSIVEVPFLGSNMAAQAVAMNRLYAENEQFRNEWEQQGIKVLSFVGVPPALTGAKEPVTTVDWYRGKTIRASGSFVSALEAVGANPAAIAVPETYEAMQHGTVDAYGGLILDVITPLSLHEVGQHIHDPGLGHYANSTWTITMDTWNSLSPELQRTLEEVSAGFVDQLVAAAERTEDAACTTILESGGSVHVFSEAETQKWREAWGDAPMNNWVEKAKAAGVADPAAMYEEFRGYYEDAASTEFADYRSGIERCVARQQ